MRHDFEHDGLSLIIVADWYNEDLMRRNTFFNNNTFELWTPFMAGSNVPTLNALLDPYHIAFGEKGVFSGDFQLDKRQVMVDSGSELIRFPAGGYLISASLTEESSQILAKGLQFEEAFGLERVDLNIDKSERMVPTLGILDRVSPTSGRLSVFTDSSCLDTASASLTKCFWLIEKLVRLSSFSEANTTMLGERYRLPEDYTAHERPKKAVVEDMRDLEVEVYR